MKNAYEFARFIENHNNDFRNYQNVIRVTNWSTRWNNSYAKVTEVPHESWNLETHA